jgi:hypothetical protein
MAPPEASDTADRLRRLAAHLEAFESPDFIFGRWEPARTDADGVMQLGWYEFSHSAESLLADVRAGGWIQPFDWPAWVATAEGSRLSQPDGVASASVQELGQLLTAIVRSDRFSEGSIAGAYESGLLTAILRRAKALSEELPPSVR